MSPTPSKLYTLTFLGFFFSQVGCVGFFSKCEANGGLPGLAVMCYMHQVFVSSFASCSNSCVAE